MCPAGGAGTTFVTPGAFGGGVGGGSSPEAIGFEPSVTAFAWATFAAGIMFAAEPAVTGTPGAFGVAPLIVPPLQPASNDPATSVAPKKVQPIRFMFVLLTCACADWEMRPHEGRLGPLLAAPRNRTRTFSGVIRQFSD